MCLFPKVHDLSSTLITWMISINYRPKRRVTTALRARRCSRATTSASLLSKYTELNKPKHNWLGMSRSFYCRRDMWEAARVAFRIWLLIMQTTNPPKALSSGFTDTGWRDTSLDDATHLKTVERSGNSMSNPWVRVAKKSSYSDRFWTKKRNSQQPTLMIWWVFLYLNTAVQMYFSHHQPICKTAGISFISLPLLQTIYVILFCT